MDRKLAHPLVVDDTKFKNGVQRGSACNFTPEEGSDLTNHWLPMPGNAESIEFLLWVMRWAKQAYRTRRIAA